MRAALLGALLALSCGGERQVDVGAAIEIRGVNPGEIGAVQLAVIGNAQKYQCRDLLKSCLSTNTAALADLVPIRGDDGVDHRVLRVKAGDVVLAGGTTIKLNLPAGSNYMVVAEVLSLDESHLLASGCDLRQDVPKGDNPGLTLVARPQDPAPTCDPRL